MADFVYKTKDNSDPKGKSRVYFTCHPDDFELYFEKIKADIFKTHDCAIFYTEDMTADIDENDKENHFNHVNLLIIPVTHKLLAMPNRAIDVDVPYAEKKNISILPLIMEPQLNRLYSASSVLSKLQYLNAYKSDVTEIPYEDKLKKHLDTVLISDELAEKVRSAFDAYIFLSYRKKDRKYANELMHILHKNEKCQRIAIWFDEFLTPGRFEKTIEREINRSNLFLLLVTPNILEMPHGKPNYVMGKEYKMAKKMSKAILPVEMKKTRQHDLKNKFHHIPQTITPKQEAVFCDEIINNLNRLGMKKHEPNPENDYLLGLAYIEGIDVERNYIKGANLILSAARKKHPDAMKRMHDIYSGVGLNNRIRSSWLRYVWAYRYYSYCIENYGEKDERTIEAIHMLAVSIDLLRNSEKAMEMLQRVYNLRCEVLGDGHADTLDVLNDIAKNHMKAERLLEALACYKRIEETSESATCRLIARKSIADLYSECKNYEAAIEINSSLYKQSCEMLGEEDDFSLMLYNRLSFLYRKMGEYEKELEIRNKIYEIKVKQFGEQSSQALIYFTTMISPYLSMGNFDKALGCLEKFHDFNKKFKNAEGKQVYGQFVIEFSCMIGEKCLLLDNSEENLGYKRRAYALLNETVGQKDELTQKIYTQLFPPKENEDALDKEDQSQEKSAKSADKSRLRSNLLDLLAGSYKEERFKQLVSTVKNILNNSIDKQRNNEKVFFDFSAYGNIKDVMGYQKQVEYFEMFCSGCSFEEAVIEESIREDVFEIIRIAIVAYRNTSEFDIAKQLEIYYDYLKQSILPESERPVKEISEIERLERDYPLMCEIWGKTHEKTFDTLFKLANQYKKEENYTKAAEFFGDLYEQQCEKFGVNNLATIKTLNGYAHTFTITKEWARARELYEILYEACHTVLGETHFDTVGASEWLAYVYEEIGEYEKALELNKRAYQTYVDMDGEKSPNALTLLQVVANTHQKNGEYAIALELSERVYALRCEVLGKEHDDTLFSLSKINELKSK